MNIIKIDVEDGRGKIEIAVESYGDGDRIEDFIRDAKAAMAQRDELIEAGKAEGLRP